MTKRQRLKQPGQDISSAESKAAYDQALQLLKDRAEGYVPYDRIFTAIKQIKSSFPRIVGGMLMNFLGHRFYWKRPAGGDLILYAKNEENPRLKDRGLVEICRLPLPDSWVGVGRFKIDWPVSPDCKGAPLFLLSLYLYSTDTVDFNTLVGHNEEVAAFMAAIFLDKENGEIFNQLATERYASLL